MDIHEVGATIGLSSEDLVPYGRNVAKVDLSVMKRSRHTKAPAKLILVSAINPTPAGEGKTTTSIGIAQALHRLGERSVVALREPSLGPCFGVKGGGTGGGKSQLVPSNRINLHFTGDLHAITAANNTLAAMVDNHLHFGLEPKFDARRVVFRRVLDVNDRALRNITMGLGGPKQGVPRETGFDITAASEVMAALCLASNEEDLRVRLGRIVVALAQGGRRITAEDIGATGAMYALLFDAIQPNLVQTGEGSPALVHGGPFANIAHGCNSLIATKMGLHLADWVVTEAGFGADLGAEKFLDIKARLAGLEVSAVVVVATVKALKMHGGTSLKELNAVDPEAVARGLCNLEKHIDTIQKFGLQAVVAINRFGSDADAEHKVIADGMKALGVPVIVADPFGSGGAGCELLAKQVMAVASARKPTFLYELNDPIEKKLNDLVRAAYGADGVALSELAKKQIAGLVKHGYGALPLCMAKTPSSLSDNPALRGRPTGFTIQVASIQVNAGAGFLVVLTGDIMRMPGLPRRPHALDVDVVNGEIVGIG
jgi:formate--tetrahydrofolate ligase